MIRYTLRSGPFFAIFVATSMAAAQSTHVHGEGQVNIAIDGNHIFMELESPGADIVGFEHKARTSAEKTAVSQALAKLSDPLLLMRFEANADCEVRRASAGIEGEQKEGEGQEHDEHEGEDAHGAFVAGYEFECANINALGLIEFTYFSQFANALSLDIVLIDGSGQRHAEVDRSNPVLQLKK